MSSIPMLMRSWWVPALRGALAILFGVFALAMPGVTLLSLIAVFAVYALLGGAVAMLGALRNRKTAADWWVLLLLGIVSLTAGVLAALRPGLTALALVFVIGVNAMVIGVLDIVLSIRLRKVIHGEWLLILSAVTSIVFGLLIVAYPGAGALALVWMIGAYALLTGILYLALAYRVRSGERRGPKLVEVPLSPSQSQRSERRLGERRRMVPSPR